MLGEFMYHNPTTLYFGSQSLENLDRELPLYGPNVLLVYGGGSIKKNGIYDAVLSLKCTLFTGHPVRRVHFALYD